MITKFLQDNYESELITFLKKIYQEKKMLSEVDKKEMTEYETGDYALLGIIGLILKNKPRILLGKKQPYDKEIQDMCRLISVSHEELADMADKFLEDDFIEDSEFVLRKVMLEYPYERNE